MLFLVGLSWVHWRVIEGEKDIIIKYFNDKTKKMELIREMDD